jgi:hypothetical protein
VSEGLSRRVFKLVIGFSDDLALVLFLFLHSLFLNDEGGGFEQCPDKTIRKLFCAPALM